MNSLISVQIALQLLNKNCHNKKIEEDKVVLNKKAFFNNLCYSEEFKKNPLQKGEFVVVSNEQVQLRTMNEKDACDFILDVIQDDCYLHIQGYPDQIYIF